MQIRKCLKTEQITLSIEEEINMKNSLVMICCLYPWLFPFYYAIFKLKICEMQTDSLSNSSTYSESGPAKALFHHIRWRRWGDGEVLRTKSGVTTYRNMHGPPSLWLLRKVTKLYFLRQSKVSPRRSQCNTMIMFYFILFIKEIE